MTNKILIAYASNAGSTAEIAEKIAEDLRQGEQQVDVRSMSAVADISAYDAVIVGAPMIVGWHRGAVKFLKAHERELSPVPTAYFITSLELTRTGVSEVGGVPIFVDPTLGHPPKTAGKLSFKERQTTETAYLQPVLKAAPTIHPVSVAFFGGKLDYSKLSFLHKLFVRIIIRGKAGDYRHWETIHTWAGNIGSALSSR